MNFLYKLFLLMLIFITTIYGRGGGGHGGGGHGGGMGGGWSGGGDPMGSYPNPPAGNPFTCSVDSFVFFSDSKNYPTDAYVMDIAGGTYSLGAENFYSTNINAIGYNVKDNYIWGYDRASHKVVRIDDNYHVESYTIAGLPTYGFHIGDVSPDGILFLSSRNDAPGVIYRVDLNPATPVKLSNINLSKTNLNTADFAFHPGNGMIYVPNKTDKHLYEINPINGNVIDKGYMGIASYKTSNVTFFDKDNNFYFNNSNDNYIYKIDLTNTSLPNTASQFTTFAIPSQGDGARCIYAPMIKEDKNSTISGTVFVDLAGDGLLDGDTNINDRGQTGDQWRASSVIVHLFEDSDSDGELDSSDKHLALDFTTNSKTTNDGRYEFNVTDGKYFIVVESRSVRWKFYNYPPASVWAEQTYGPKGGFCNDGAWGSVKLAAAGSCYGGRRGNFDDGTSSDGVTILSDLTDAEHVALVEVNENNVTNIDFGFSFNVVTNDEDTGQGSLRQFIENANEIRNTKKSKNKMRFVPAVPLKNGNSWWSINLASKLPDIEDEATTINGIAYNFDGSIRDENSGTISGGTKLGTGVDALADSGDEPTLDAFNKPELEIIIDSSEQFGFKIFANDINISNVAIYGASGILGDVFDEDNGNIHIAWQEETDDIVIENNFIGVRPDGTVPVSKSSAYGINFYNSKSEDFKIFHNYISSVGKGGIYLTGSDISDGTISQNEVQNVNWFGKRDDGLAIESGVHNISVFENYTHDNDGPGLESYEGGTNNRWYNNTVYNNGYGGGSTEFFGMRLVGSPGEAYQNHIYNNKDIGILVQGTSTSEQKIYKNSIYNNGTLSIDLDITDDGIDGDGINFNNGVKDNNKANKEMDSPVFTVVAIEGSVIHVEGYVGSAPSQNIFGLSMIEIYKADSGEGRWYLGTCTSDANGNFNCDINIDTSIVSAGDMIIATATSWSNTSEFGSSKVIETAIALGCSQNAWVLNDTKNIYEFNPIDGNSTAFLALNNITNAIGYNQADSFVWGYNNDDDLNQTLVRIGKDIYGNYKSELFGTIKGAAGQPDLPSSAYINVGDIDANGHMYLLHRKNASLGLSVEEDNLYVIDLNSSSINYLKVIDHSIISDGGNGLNIDDWAFHPNNGKLYSVSETGRFYEINPSTGNVKASDIITGLETNSSYETFFDNNGYMYVYAAHAGKVFRIDLTDPNNPVPEAILFSTFTSGTGGDSARCNKASMGDVPIMVIDDVTNVEGHSDTKDYLFTVSLDRPAIAGTGFWRTVTDGGDNPPDANYGEATFADLDMTQDGGGYLGADFETVLVGSTSHSFIVKINGDKKVEADERFFVDIYSPDFAVIVDSRGEGIIINDDYNITLNAYTKNDGNITTQVVNKPFNLVISAYNHTTDEWQKDVNITSVDIIDENGENISTWNDLLVTDASGKVRLSHIVNKAMKIAKIRIGGNYDAVSYNNRAKDDFAIRPDSFMFEIPQSIKAGENFILGVKALDYQDANSIGYSEDINSSFNISYRENKPDCTEKKIDLSGIRFSNGLVSTDINYSEVGVLDFNISEILGSEFALVDENDTSEIDRLITPTTAPSIRFTAGGFNISDWSLSDGAKEFTYYASGNEMLDMGANLEVHIQAINAYDEVVKNYTPECYARNVNLKIDYEVLNPNEEEHTIMWRDINPDGDESGEQNLTDSVNSVHFNFDVNASKFMLGETIESIKINFDRSSKKAKNPIRFSISDINASGDGASGNNEKDEDVDFYYGRLHVPNYTGIGKEHNLTVYQEVFCEGCDKDIFTYAKGRESEDGVNWFVLEENQYSTGSNVFSGVKGNNDYKSFNTPHTMTATYSNATLEGVDTIRFSLQKIPLKDRISYTPKPWLNFSRFSNSGSHHFYMNISSKAETWAGKGEQGKSIDNAGGNVKSYNKMDW